MTKITRIERISALIEQQLAPSLLDIRDQSQQHAGHAGAPQGSEQTHLHIVIQAESLAGKSRVQQHRAVMDLLKTEFDNDLHAVSIEVQA